MVSQTQTGFLSSFLSAQRTKYLQDVDDGKGKEWVVVMGNEAGDLDSIASSIGYALLATDLENQESARRQYVPLVQTARADLGLRPENIQAFKNSSLRDDHEDLLCIDDLPTPTPSSPFPSNKFVLVDHNRLGDAFAQPSGDEEVIALLDHHEDEGLYPSADPRTINSKAGSCTSLITTHFVSSPKWNSEIAQLLLSGICIDTGGLKPGGKAIDVDNKAASFVLPIASGIPAQDIGPDIADNAFIKSLTKDLSKKKENVGDLPNRDLLRRDYKQYDYTSASDPSSKPTVVVGLASVPIDLKDWVSRDPSAFAAWMDERNLTILGALTSFDRKKGGVKEHHRQSLWMIHPSAPADLDEVLWKGLEGDTDLKLTEIKDWKEKMGMKGMDVRARAYKHGDVKLSRKAVAPLVKTIMDGYLGGLAAE